MNIAIVCKVIDNFGDAGFCVRLARALATRQISVVIFHDNPVVVRRLLPEPHAGFISLIDARVLSEHDLKGLSLDLIVEPFGSSSEETAFRFDALLKREFPTVPWVVVDYLSAEPWVEGFHKTSSTHPQSGHVSTFFYPGFTVRTGGLIHADVRLPTHSEIHTHKTHCQRVFMFCYPSAPLPALLSCLDDQVELGIGSNVGVLNARCAVSELPFVPQADFDDLLNGFDLLFVRGEDSFVRAQLLGKPFVWQVYPTEDGYHLVKLEHFLSLYLEGCSSAVSAAIRDLWGCWNGGGAASNLVVAWEAFQKYWPDIQTHALDWQARLLAGPELVSEILNWYALIPPKKEE